MDVTTLDRADLLAMGPAALFGELEPREVKRRYATLIKRFREDTEVSAHVRGLYEAVRDGALASPDEPPVADDPCHQLAAALHEGRLRDVARWILEAGAEIRRRDPGLLIVACRTLIKASWLDWPAGLVEAMLHVIDDPALEMDVSWHIGLANHEALRRGMEDPTAAPLAKALLDSRHTDPASAVFRMHLLAKELRIQAVSLDFEALSSSHPRLMAQLNQLELATLAVLAPAPLPIPADALSTLRLRYQALSRPSPTWSALWGFVASGPPGSLLEDARLGLYRDVVGGFGTAALLAMFCGGSLAMGSGVVQAALMGMGALIATVYAAWRLRFWMGVAERVLPMDGTPARQACADHGVFPRELARKLDPNPPPLSEDFAFAEHHALMALDTEPGLWVRMLTDAHCARVAHAWSLQEAA